MAAQQQQPAQEPTPSVPWDPVVAVLVDVLRAGIESHARGRGVLTRAVHVLPLLCREARDDWRAQPLAPWLLLYQLHVLNDGFLWKRYYDAVPSSIDFDRGPNPTDYATNPNPNGDWSNFGIREVAADSRVWMQTTWLIKARHAYACAVDRGDTKPDPEFYGHPDQWLATKGIPDGLPLPVRRLVAFMRFLNRRTLHALQVYFQPGEMGAFLDEQCARKGCARGASSVETDRRGAEVGGAFAYWELCRTGVPLDRNKWNRMSSPFTSLDYNFCCTTCARQTCAEYERLVQCCDVEDLTATLDATAFLPPTRARRPPRTHGERQQAAADWIAPPAVPTARLLQAARERNELFRRRMNRSCVTTTTPIHLPMSLEGAAAIRRSFVLALNVDTALLYAASVLSELPKTQRPKKALPTHGTWRAGENTDALYCKAVVAIHRILNPTTSHLAGNNNNNTEAHTRLLAAESTQPRWLQRVKDRALVLF